MIHMVYPESRMVSEDTVIVWAMDSLINARIDAGEFMQDDDGSHCAAAMAILVRPSLSEAIEILEDAGECTFNKSRVMQRLGYGGCTGWADYLMSDESVQTVRVHDGYQGSIN